MGNIEKLRKNIQKIYPNLEVISLPDHSEMSDTLINALKDKTVIMTKKDSVKLNCEHENWYYIDYELSVSNQLLDLISGLHNDTAD